MRKLGLLTNTPFILTSNCTSDVEERGGALRPYIRDLEVKSLSNIADKIIMLYRPEIYGITMDEDGELKEDKIELYVGKNKKGELGSIKMQMESNCKIIEL